MAKRLSESAKREMQQKLFPAAVAVIKGGKSNFKLRGSSLEEIAAVKGAVTASRDFFLEVRNPDATIASVNEKLQMKHKFAQRFETVFGFPWPL